MLDDAWVALVTDPNGEYTARLELERLGLQPYLPQYKRLWRPAGASKPLSRFHPLFPRYVFLPLSQARLRPVHYVRGLKHPKPILSDAEGRFWTATADEIFRVAQLEHQGGFDETLSVGDAVHPRSGALSDVAMVLSQVSAKTCEVFLPLFGGCRGRAPAAAMARGS